MKRIWKHTLLLGALLLPLGTASNAQEHRVRVGYNSPRASVSVGFGSSAPRIRARLNSYRSPRYRSTHRRSSYAHTCRWRTERVWVDGGYERIWVDPVYETRYDECGNAYRVLTCEGYWDKVYTRGHWARQRVKVCCR